MKSDPDRLDLLIVVLPVVLAGVLGFQAYRFVVARGERASGSELARQVLAEAPAVADPSGPGPAEKGTPPEDAGEAPAIAEEIAGKEPGGEEAAEAGSPSAADEPRGSPDQGEAPPEVAAEGAAPGKAPAGAATGAAPATGATAAPGPSVAPDGDPSLRDTAPAPGAAGAAAPSQRQADAAAGRALAGGAVTGVPSAGPATPVDEPAGDAADPADSSGTGASGSAAARGGAGGRQPAGGVAEVRAVPRVAAPRAGEVIPVDITIANGHNVGSVPFHLRYDPAVLRLNPAPRSERGDFLSVPGVETQFLVAPGPSGNEVVVGLSLMGAQTGASGDGTLATIYFLSLAPGNTSLVFTSASVRGPDARQQRANFIPASLTILE